MRSGVYALPPVKFKILEKFSEHFAGTLIYRLQRGTMRAHSYIDVGRSR